MSKTEEVNGGGYPVKNASYWRKKAIQFELANHDLTERIELLREARDAAYVAADSFKACGNDTGEAQCFGEGIGLEKAAMLVFGKVL